MVSDFAEQFRAAMQQPAVKTRLNELGFLPAGICGADFSAVLRKQYEDYGRIIRDANMRAD